jgi:hypothetical protein
VLKQVNEYRSPSRGGEGGKMEGFLQEIISEAIKEDNNFDTIRIRFKDSGREHYMKELTDFNSDGIEDIYIVVENGFRQRRIVFKAVYDSDKEL